jgi:hypothetical protein
MATSVTRRRILTGIAVTAAAPLVFSHAAAALGSLSPEYTGVPFWLSGWVDRLLPRGEGLLASEDWPTLILLPITTLHRSGLRVSVGARVEFLVIDRRVGAYCSRILAVDKCLTATMHSA